MCPGLANPGAVAPGGGRHGRQGLIDKRRAEELLGRGNPTSLPGSAALLASMRCPAPTRTDLACLAIESILSCVASTLPSNHADIRRHSVES